MNNIAMLIACEHYQDDGLSDLHGVDHDVEIMKTALENSCNCKNSSVHILISEDPEAYQPAGSDIIKFVSETLDNYTEEQIDILYFYYSGHGCSIDNNVYIIPSNGLLDNPPYGLISLLQLQNKISQYDNIKHVVIFLDMCQSELLSKKALSHNTEFEKGMVIFHSCAQYNESYMLPEGKGKGSIFTLCLADILGPKYACQTVREVSDALKIRIEQYCKDYRIRQKPHTTLEDASLADLVICSKDNESNTDQYEIDDNLNLDLSIWLVDAEKAIGDQARFRTFTKTTAVNEFLSPESKYWGIATVKGIGKTFLLQVKRVKMSNSAICFPRVDVPSKDNNWATEKVDLIKDSSSFASKSYHDIQAMWRFSLLSYIIHCWIALQTEILGGKNSAKAKVAKKRYDKIVLSINKRLIENKLCQETVDFLVDPGYAKLQMIYQGLLIEQDVNRRIQHEYVCLQYFAHTILNEISADSKNSIVLFIDKLDQALRQPTSEYAIDCDICSKQESVISCNNPQQSDEYCNSVGEGACPQKINCCYGCEKYSNNYAGTDMRIGWQEGQRGGHCNYWQRLQLGLVEAVSDLQSDFDGRIKVIYTIRLEACNSEVNVFGTQRAKITGLTQFLNYSRKEQEKIYKESIRHQHKTLLFNPELANKIGREDEAFVGVESICHPYVSDVKESLFDIIYRHSFDRSRDIQDYGNALTVHLHEIRAATSAQEREGLVKRIIEETAERLAYNTNPATISTEHSYFFEKQVNMPSYWADTGHFETLLSLIDRNLLFQDDVRLICQKINGVTVCPDEQCKICKHHPFSALKNLGMLGYIVLSANRQVYSQQFFLDAQDVTYFHDVDNLQINNHTMYLIHPALTKSIEKLKNDKIMHFCGFVIGKGLSVKQTLLNNIFRDKLKMSVDNFEDKYYKKIKF